MYFPTGFSERPVQNKVPFGCIKIWSQTIAVAMGAEHSVLCRHEGRGMEKHKSGTDWPRYTLALSTMLIPLNIVW